MPTPNADDPLRITEHEPGLAKANSDRTADHLPGSSAATGDTAGFVTGQHKRTGRLPKSVAVPGYAIEAVLGRGGMGIVYRARHLALKRTVALKMILAGGHAGAGELARFRIEAEAVARLQHPNIVQVFEVGEADGHPFCALEYVDGGNLAARIDGQALPAREAARLVEALARAMHLAHSRNVVHRDLKPANILLASNGRESGDPLPKITDFGLARQLDSDSGETQVGAVIGTPSYMAPEQASGRAHEAGPAADIYALGAILYACLAGRAPFQGRTVVETLDQVRTQEPVPPSHWHKSVPLDLETICLKCLRKEPEKRYASAAELADDLGRFLRAEPVLARPVGRAERGWRWCRRNPALALALATVVAVLVIASVISTLFAFDADSKKAAAEAARNDLARKHTELEQKQAEVVQKNKEMVQKQAELEHTLVRSWLFPLASRPGPLTDAEVFALEQVAAQRDKPLALRFIREAATDKQLTPRLRARAEYALHAAVGLDPRKRAEVERLLLAELRSSGGSSLRQEDLAYVAATLGDLSPETEASALATLLQATNRTMDPVVLHYLAPGLAGLAARMGPRKAAATLLQAMSQTTSSVVLQHLGQGLPAVAARLSPREAVAAATTLHPVMSKMTDRIGLQHLARGLSVLAARMEPREGAATLLQAMTRTADPYLLQQLAQDLPALVAHLPPREAAETAATLLQVLNKTTDPVALGNLAEGLSAFAGRLEPREAVTLLQALTRTTHPGVLQILGRSLPAVAAHLPPREAAEAAAMLAQAMTRTTDRYQLQALAPSLLALVDRLGPREAAAATATLLPLIQKITNPFVLAELAEVLAALAGRLEPREAATLCSPAAATLLQAMSTMKISEPDTFRALARGLSALAARLEPKVAAARCGEAVATLNQAIRQTTSPLSLSILTEGLSVLAARLEPKEAATLYDPAAATLLQAIRQTPSMFALRDLSEGLSTLAGRLDSTQAAALCSQAAATLTRALSQKTNPGELRLLAQGLSALARRMEPREAVSVCSRAAATLAQAISRTTQPGALHILAEGLSVVAARMGPTEAALVCRPAAATLAQAMSRTTDPNALQFLAMGLTALADRLEAREADAVCSPAAATVLQVMSKTTHPMALRTLSHSLSVLAARMEPRKAAAMLLHVMSKTDMNLMRDLALGLSTVLSRSGLPDNGQLSSGVAGVVGGVSGPWSLLTTSPHLQRVLNPVPPLPAQMLVDILNDPLCVGRYRRLVLEQLTRHYGRPFADPWEFVRFAEEKKLGLDFSHRPQRP